MDIEGPGAEPQQQQPAAATAAGLSEQEAKRLRKLEQNRLAAQLSRQRKKQRTEELQKHILEVSCRAIMFTVSHGVGVTPDFVFGPPVESCLLFNRCIGRAQLQQQNQELQQATTKLYGLLVAESGKDALALMDELHAENSSLKYTLYQRLQAVLYRSDRMYVQHPGMFYRPLSAGPGGSRPETPADDSKDSRSRGSNGAY